MLDVVGQVRCFRTRVRFRSCRSAVAVYCNFCQSSVSLSGSLYAREYLHASQLHFLHFMENRLLTVLSSALGADYGLS